MSGPNYAAILVNYNAGEELRHALLSIADEMAGQPWEGVVVDNASVDESAAFAAEFAPAVRVIRNERNVGFATAVNQGLAATTAPWVLIMNPDCRLVAHAIEALRHELDLDPLCAAAGPKILNPDGSVQGSARGDPDMFTGLFGRTALLRRMLPKLAVSKRNVVAEEVIRSRVASVDVDWLSGACLLARRKPLTEVGGFDERYFLYWEDADLCRRLRARGYNVRYVPGATAVHRVGHSSRTAHAASLKAFHRSAYLYYATHVAPGWFNPKRPMARLLLAARCRWQLRRAIPKEPRKTDASP
jgi:GT2 family glycosyltransferase